MPRQTHPLLSHRPFTEKGKVVSAREAVNLIRDGDALATGGFVGIGFAEHLAVALEQRFLKTGQPRDLTLMYAAGQGDGKSRGLNHLGHEGLVAKVIGGHWGLVPKLQKLAVEGRIQAWNLPQGVISHLFRDIAAGKPGTLSRVGLGTFVDPRLDGGRINDATREEIVRLLPIDGEEYLFYKAQSLQVAFLRGTTADTLGNVTMEHEALVLESLAIATAVHNCGGVVIVQVERLAERATLHPKDVKIPGVLVDCVVICDDPEHHWQTFSTRYNPAYSGEIKAPMATLEPMPLSARKIIARRAAFELRPNAVVNLGIGMPEGVGPVASEERVLELLTLTAEPGVIGGLPASGLDFGAALNTQAIIDQPAQFDFYDGGGLDIAFLGMAQVDGEGNVNVSKFGSRLAGAGGFINISQRARKVVFMGTFLAAQGELAVADGRLKLAEGGLAKFVEGVEHRTFSGPLAIQEQRDVLYVTERCVFQLTAQGVTLIELAPGVDLDRDVLALMNFTPAMPAPPSAMDGRIFLDHPMGLRDDLLSRPLEQRFTFDAAEEIFFVDFENLRIKSQADIDAIRHAAESRLAPLGRRVYAVVNYDNFRIDEDLLETYTAMVSYLEEHYYSRVTRYTTSGFLRMKLGDALEQRALSPHIYDNAEEAREHLKP
ncbi:acyl CoA:acetate/3-ketoacid CoA transferase [Pistricoccus aurantiacus]|uniref:Acyl CoA:acetate/3-ketoacid CoA transferase n=1 Tax=Pistricoccus aurantiacus TaxID=1883414 RepID=A0A5B8SRK6_9GAMM|nr:acyl CoA:acetate/3-ketoacid CoA transferase [Pistricoccus aurantiacus]QEA38874.1 acyl CoA:acetate/3-ketoacid CoA transferase [Pistricoccus aurantiacus]